MDIHRCLWQALSGRRLLLESPHKEDWRDKAPIAKWQRISAFVYLVCMFESGSNTIAYWVALLLGPRGEPKA